MNADYWFETIIFLSSLSLFLPLWNLWKIALYPYESVYGDWRLNHLIFSLYLSLPLYLYLSLCLSFFPSHCVSLDFFILVLLSAHFTQVLTLNQALIKQNQSLNYYIMIYLFVSLSISQGLENVIILRSALAPMIEL